MQTLIVHGRTPRALFGALGPRRFLAMMSLFSAGLLGPLFWPFFAAAVGWDMVAGDLFHPVGAIGTIRATMILLLVYLGAVATIVPLVLGAWRQGLTRLLWLAPLFPLWHVGLCAAAWCAVVDLVRAPYRWAKTDHGLARSRRDLAQAAVVKPGASVMRMPAGTPQ